MKKNMKLTVAVLSTISLLTFSNCSKKQDENPDIIEQTANDPADPQNEDSGIITAEEDLISYSAQTYQKQNSSVLKYDWVAHKNFVYTCAKKLGLSDHRAIIMRDAAIMPDVYQKGIDNAYNQQWSHAYMASNMLWGMQWLWGDADDDFHDNLHGDSGESESPEGYNEKWAGYYYEQGDKDLGDWYVGYACHFMTDVSLLLHSSAPTVNLLAHHFDYEAWIDNNWTEGHNFSQVINEVNVNSFHTITNAKEGIRNAVETSCIWFNDDTNLAWKNYKESGYPTAAGSGNSECVYYTKKMLVETVKWTGAAIKHALDTYNQW